MPGFKYINVEGKTTEFQRAIKIKRKKTTEKESEVRKETPTEFQYFEIRLIQFLLNKKTGNKWIFLPPALLMTPYYFTIRGEMSHHLDICFHISSETATIQVFFFSYPKFW